MLKLEDLGYACICDWYERVRALSEEQGKVFDGKIVQRMVWGYFKRCPEDAWKYHETLRVLMEYDPEFFREVRKA